MISASHVGKSERRDDVAWPLLAKGLAATLNVPCPADGRWPPLWHWLLFQEWVPAGALGADGHAVRGGFLPAEPTLPRRMWAGGRLQMHHALHTGAAVWRDSRIVRVQEKSGATGRLLFVTVHHAIADERGVAISEEQDLVFLGARAGSAAAPAEPLAAAVRRAVPIDSTLLFRYSALTGNAHRIHYDRDYAAEEGYPSLVVHGPLQATLLAGLAAELRPGRMLVQFAFRARRAALLHRCPLTLEAWDDGARLQLRTVDGEDAICTTAEASFAP